MENNNKKTQVGSSSSITSQLFGSQQSSSSSNDVFASIFPPSKGTGRNSGGSEVRGSWQKEPAGTGNQPWNNKQDNTYKTGDSTYGSSGSKERNNSIYQQQGAEPSYLSSSLYYGGQEMYSKSPSQPTSSSYPIHKKDGGEDDASGAARGNWWQGNCKLSNTLARLQFMSLLRIKNKRLRKVVDTAWTDKGPGAGRNSGGSEVRGSWQKEPSGTGNQPWNNRQDNTYKPVDSTYGSSGSKERNNSIYQQQGAEPSYLSSSLYYGGQEMYSKSPSQPTSSSYPIHKKDGGEDDASGAARGNWWQGSLYY